MRHSKRPWKRRARGASLDEVFEQALMGSDREGSARFDPSRDRKTLQLCRQVQRALMLALAGECSDDLLLDVQMASVEPMGSASQLLVRVQIPQSLPAGCSAIDVIARLNRHVPSLRAAVAQSICRKRVPTLTFIVEPSTEERGPSDER